MFRFNLRTSLFLALISVFSFDKNIVAGHECSDQSCYSQKDKGGYSGGDLWDKPSYKRPYSQAESEVNALKALLRLKSEHCGMTGEERSKSGELVNKLIDDFYNEHGLSSWKDVTYKALAKSIAGTDVKGSGFNAVCYAVITRTFKPVGQEIENASSGFAKNVCRQVAEFVDPMLKKLGLKSPINDDEFNFVINLSTGMKNVLDSLHSAESSSMSNSTALLLRESMKNSMDDGEDCDQGCYSSKNEELRAEAEFEAFPAKQMLLSLSSEIEESLRAFSQRVSSYAKNDRFSKKGIAYSRLKSAAQTAANVKKLVVMSNTPSDIVKGARYSQVVSMCRIISSSCDDLKVLFGLSAAKSSSRTSGGWGSSPMYGDY